MQKVLMKEKWGELSPDEKKARQKESANAASRSHRAYLKTLSPEALAEYKDNQRWKKEERARERARKEEEKKHKALIARELSVLEFMKRTGFYYYHHGAVDNIEDLVERAIKRVKEGEWQEYNLYAWLHQIDKSNYMSICQFGKLWRHSEFDSIYDVPLDGSWLFYSYDSGERGAGAFHRISAYKKDEKPKLPFVNPGGFPPITAF